MAKIKFQEHVAAMSGKLNGSVFASNRSGAYVRTNSKQIRSNTNAQQNIRSLFKNLATDWAQLTEAERLAWNNAIVNYPIGSFYKEGGFPTGNVLYNTINGNIVRAGGIKITLPPERVPASQISNFSILSATVDDSIFLNIAPLIVPLNMCLQVQATKPISSGFMSNNSQVRIIKMLQENDSTTLNFYQDYVNNFGHLVIGQKIFFRISMINKLSGETSLPLTSSIIIQP